MTNVLINTNTDFTNNTTYATGEDDGKGTFAKKEDCEETGWEREPVTGKY